MGNLAMASAAAYGGFHVPFFDKFFTELTLGGSCGRYPIHIGHLIEGAKMIFWGSMALEAPTHAVGFCVVDDLHVVDLAVALDATDPTIHVNGVVEVDVVRSFVDPNPRNRIPAFP